MQRDRRVPAAEADTLAGEAVTADLQDAARELDELAQIGGADTVIPCRRAGSSRRSDAQHLAGRQRRQIGSGIGAGGSAFAGQAARSTAADAEIDEMAHNCSHFRAQTSVSAHGFRGYSSAASSSAI